MKILKYRTIAEVYPYLSLEAQVQMDNGDIVYPNISVNKKGEQEEYVEWDDSHWTYKMPLTEVDFENVDDCYYDLTPEQDTEIYKMLLDLWNNNPKFDNDYNWKSVS